MRQTAGSPARRPIATELSVEARAGGVCVVRVVQSLFASTDDWDDQLIGTEWGMPGAFRILRIYLTHFRGPALRVHAISWLLSRERQRTPGRR